LLIAKVGQGPLNQTAVMEILLLQADVGVEATGLYCYCLSQNRLKQEALPADEAIAISNKFWWMLDQPLQSHTI